jgi:hypothetical protein
MKTKSDINRLALKWCAALEEDEGYRGMRVFQFVAPHGRRWNCDDILSLRLEWATGATPQAVKFNQAAYIGIESRLRCGTAPIPNDEAYLYQTD